MGLLRRLSLENSSTEPLGSRGISPKNRIYEGGILVRTEKKVKPEDKQVVEVPISLEIVMSKGDGGFSAVCIPLPPAGFPSESDLKDFLTCYNPQGTLRTATYHFRHYLTEAQDFSGRTERQIDQATWPTTFESAVSAIRKSTSKY